MVIWIYTYIIIIFLHYMVVMVLDFIVFSVNLDM